MYYIYVLPEKLQPNIIVTTFNPPRNIPWNLSGSSQTPASPPWNWWKWWHLFLVWLKRATEADNKPSDMFGLIIFLPWHVRVPPPAACSVPQAEPCGRIFTSNIYLLIVIGDLSDHAACWIQDFTDREFEIFVSTKFAWDPSDGERLS